MRNPTFLNLAFAEWDERENTSEVIEGNGGNTEWGMWMIAVENQEKSFALTVPMPLMKGQHQTQEKPH
jgi:hypothetical protein